jgi:penicillin-binding protein 1A
VIFRSRYSIGRLSSKKGSIKRSLGARHQAKRNRQELFQNIGKKLLFLGISGALIGSVLLGSVLFYIISIKGLPDVSVMETMIPDETTKLYSADNVILAELHLEENRQWVFLKDISPILPEAVIAVEDSNFYEHHGLDFKGILRALVADVKAGSFVQGGSTLTQQLARNLFLSKRKSIWRKLEEAILAVQIERRYTKSDILEWYLNQVYWGHNTYGIQSSSMHFFGKPARDLEVQEAAMLTGILVAPEYYSPFKSISRAKRRQRLVLNRLVDQKIISKEDANTAYNVELEFTKQKKFSYKAPYFTSHIIKQLKTLYGEEAIYTSGMKVFTTLNYELQQEADKIVKKYVEIGARPTRVRGIKVPSLNYEEAALISIDPRTGYIKAMQGGYDFLKNQFNRTTQAKRQPGSSFKPFIYLTALEKGFSPGTFIEDAPVTYNTVEGPYSPSNYSQKNIGWLPMRKALEKSVNVIAIKLNYLIGPEHLVDVAKQIGIRSPLKPILSLPLGANEVTMIELASAYGVFANNGIRVEPTGIIRIEDRDGTPLYEHKIRESKVFDKNLIAVLVDMMQGVVKYGTGRRAGLPSHPVAGKTGTTSDYRDAWFVGFVPQLVTAAWVGNDDNSPTYKITGGSIPASIWKEFMTKAVQILKIPKRKFPKPRGLVEKEVNWLTQKLATEFSPKDYVTKEKYWKGSEPKEYDTVQDSLWNAEKKEDDNSNFLDFFSQ